MLIVAFLPLWAICIPNTYIPYDTLDVPLDSSNLNIDSTLQAIDSVLVDTNAIDSVGPRMESTFKSKVTYHADDSLMLDNENNKAYLWGKAWVKYEDIELKADYLEIDFEKNEVFAAGMQDSNGVLQNTPIFNEKGQEYESKEILYNFNTKKGLIQNTTTQQSSGYIHGDRVKMETQDVFYIRNGRYTTCNLDHPHYYIKAGKLKMINNDKVITGPAYMAVEDVPTFLAMPFGFFPNQDKRTSGVVVPTFGSSAEKGFFLQRGGYYWAISDQVDAKLTGDVYTNGTWAMRLESRYLQRYKRSGNFQLSYTDNKVSEKDAPDYARTTSYFIDWNHSQDPKASLYSDFSARVRFGSANYFQNDLATSNQDYVRNEFNSNITFRQKIPNTPFTFALNAAHSQNRNNNEISITLPKATLTMARIYPLKRKNPVGRQKWYEKIGLTYNSEFKNQLDTELETFDDPDTWESLRNGAKHDAAISTSIKAGPINISPGVTYQDVWYFKSQDQIYLPESDSIRLDTTFGFQRYGSGNINTSFSTKLYGMYEFNGPNLKAMRHTMTPSITASYRPSIANTHPEYFKSYTDTTGRVNEYTIFDGGIYGAPTKAEQGLINFRIENILEMKHKPANDTNDEYKNTTLIEAFNLNTAYDAMADSLNWKDLTIDFRTRIGKYVNIRANSNHNFYAYNVDPETGEASLSKEFEINRTGNLFRTTRAQASLGLNFKGESGGSKKDQDRVNDINQTADPNIGAYGDDRYIDFNIPWDLRANYVLTYTKPYDEVSIVNSLTFSGSVNVTPGWKVRIRSSYDFEQQKLGLTTIDIYRDLHCWQIDLTTTPFGSRKGFSVNIKVKQGFLQDLKLSKTQNYWDN